MRAAHVVLLLAVTLSAVFWAGSEAGRRAERALRAQATEPMAALPDAVERALAIPAAGARASALELALEDAGAGDIEGVFGRLYATNLSIDVGSLLIVFDWAASHDPAATLKQAVLLHRGDTLHALPALFRRWARTDPAGARAALEKIEDPSGVDALWEALVMGWVERESDTRESDTRVWSFVEALDMGPLRQKLLRVLVVQKVLIEGIDATLAYVESIPDDARLRFKLQAFRRVASVLGFEDPERAVAWARKHATKDYGDGILRKVAIARVLVEGGPGITWLGDVEPSGQRDEAVTEAYRRWMMKDRETALAWLPGTTPNAALDPAWAIWVGATGRRDPEAAVAGLERIQGQAQREAVGMRLGRIWMQRDREAALRWVEQGDLPEEHKQRLRDAAADGA